MKKNILILGGSGFLGSHLIEKLKNDYNVLCPSSLELNLESLDSILNFDSNSRVEFNYIFHCANWFKAGSFNNSGSEWIYNELMNCNVLYYWNEYQYQAKLITFGTDASYDNDLKHSENYYLDGNPNSDYYGYALTKRNMFQGILELQKQYNDLKWMHFPLLSLFGPNFKLNDKHLIHDIIKKIYKSKIDNTIPEFWGNGEQIREVTYINDLIDNILYFSLENFSNNIINLGSNKRFTVKQYVEKICDILEFNKNKVRYNDNFNRGTSKKYLDSSKARRLCKNYKDTDVDLSLKETINYYLKEINKK